jgi:hypothetical protein
MICRILDVLKDRLMLGDGFAWKSAVRPTVQQGIDLAGERRGLSDKRQTNLGSCAPGIPRELCLAVGFLKESRTRGEV